MRRIDLSEADSRVGPAAVNKPLSDALGTTDVALNYYELDPGESTAYGYHAHADQEEVFYVVDGTITFETEDGPVTVESGEAVRFGRNEYQRSHNRGDRRATVLAVGAPRDPDSTEILRECETCGERTPTEVSVTDDHTGVRAECTVCGSVTGRFD